MKEREQIINIGGDGNGHKTGYSPKTQKIYLLSYGDNSSFPMMVLIPFQAGLAVLLFFFSGIAGYLATSIHLSSVKMFVLATVVSIFLSVMIVWLSSYFDEYYSNVKISSELGEIEDLSEDTLKKVKDLKQGQFVVGGLTVLNVLSIISAYLLAAYYFITKDGRILFVYFCSAVIVCIGLYGYLNLNRTKKYRSIVQEKIRIYEKSKQVCDK